MAKPSIPGFDKANRHLKGVFLLVGLPGSGKTTLCKYFIAHYLSKKKASIYVSTDESPNSVEYSLKKFGYNPKRHNLRIIDCYSWRIGIDPNLRPQAVRPSNLTEVSIMIAKAQQGLQNFCFVLDSASSLMLDAGVSATINFLQVLSAHIRQVEGLGLVVLELGMHEEHILRTLGAILDGILQIKLEELASGRLIRFFRIFSMKNSPHVSDWIPFEIWEGGVYFTTIKLDGIEKPTFSGRAPEFPFSGDIGYEKNQFGEVLNLSRRSRTTLPPV